MRWGKSQTWMASDHLSSLTYSPKLSTWMSSVAILIKLWCYFFYTKDWAKLSWFTTDTLNCIAEPLCTFLRSNELKLPTGKVSNEGQTTSFSTSSPLSLHLRPRKKLACYFYVVIYEFRLYYTSIIQKLYFKPFRWNCCLARGLKVSL